MTGPDGQEAGVSMSGTAASATQLKDGGLAQEPIEPPPKKKKRKKFFDDWVTTERPLAGKPQGTVARDK